MEKLILSLLTVVILCCCGGLVSGRNPGFKARITARGLNYGKFIYLIRFFFSKEISWYNIVKLEQFSI